LLQPFSFEQPLYRRIYIRLATAPAEFIVVGDPIQRPGHHTALSAHGQNLVLDDRTSSAASSIHPTAAHTPPEPLAAALSPARPDLVASLESIDDGSFPPRVSTTCATSDANAEARAAASYETDAFDVAASTLVRPPGGVRRAYARVDGRYRGGAWQRIQSAPALAMAASVSDPRTNSVVVMGGYSWPDRALPPVAVDAVSRYGGVAGRRGWTPMPHLLQARSCAAAAVDWQGCVYVAGGGESMFSSAACYNTVERFSCTGVGAGPGGAGSGSSNSNSNGNSDDSAWQWEAMPPMTEARCGFGMAYCRTGNSLVACGGYGGDGKYINTLEMLDLNSNGGASAWRSLPALTMPAPRAGCQMLAGPDGRMYVVGGGPDGRQVDSSMVALDLRAKRWDTACASPGSARHYNAAGFGPDGLLYVAGTFRHSGYEHQCERYDYRTNRWEELPALAPTLQFTSGAFLF
jgi:hypothetical protein